jgi:3-methyladenine DNA glycosylase AlkD
MKKQHLKEVENALIQYSNKSNEQKEKLKRYIGTTLEVLALTSKEQNACFKKGFSFFKNDAEIDFSIVDKIYFSSNIFEVKNISFLYLHKNHQHLNIKQLLYQLPRWVTKVDNWAHSDSLSKYLTKLLDHEETKDDMEKIILKWNQSNNLWERRQSLVSLFYYSRTKKQHIKFNFAEKLILNLIDDNEYYVQKALGWTLRESYNVYPQKTYSFIAKYITRISSTAFTTSIEKMTATEKNKLKEKRKYK